MPDRTRTAGVPAQSGTGAPLLALWFATAPLLASTSSYDSLIVRARAGETGPALSMLRTLEPVNHIQFRYDHLLIASWAGRPAEAIQIYQSLPHTLAPPPPEVHLAAARAYRDLGQWQPALTILTTEFYQHPDREADFASGYIMTLTDAGKLEDALFHAQHWVEQQPDNADIQMAMAYVQTQRQQVFDALYHIDKALQLAPESIWVQREYIFALQRSGLTGPALERVRQRPDLLTPAQLRALEGDDLARQTRLAGMPSRNESERFVIADRALARYDTLIAAWQALGREAAADVTRLRIDRLSALHARMRMEDLVHEYQALLADGIILPSWALSDVAAAYLYLRAPEQARTLYQTVLDAFAAQETAPLPQRIADEDRLDNEIGLFYALAESEQFDQIPALLERLKARHGPWTWLLGQPERQPNAPWLAVHQTLAIASLLSNDTQAAQQQLETMTAAAPNNINLHTDLAAVYRARGWPRRAEQQLKLAEALEPRALGIETEQGLSALDLQEWRQAEDLSADVFTRRPELLSSRRLARQWQVHNMAELQISVNRNLASDSPSVGGGEIAIGTTVYTVPIHYNWRLFSGIGHASGRYEEGTSHHNWQRAGVEWRSRNLRVEGAISHHHYGAGNRPGARVMAAYDLSDHLQIGGTVERLSEHTPLRALRSGVFANSLEAYLHWRGSEHREWHFALAPMRFSDGNQRWALNVDGTQRLHTTPHLTLDLLLEASVQHNSQGGEGLYFNPRHDLIVLPGLRLTQILHRRYETLWEHVATISAGSDSQQGEGTSGVIALRYGQRYQRNDALAIGGALDAISRPYDGRREHELRLLFDLNYRF